MSLRTAVTAGSIALGITAISSLAYAVTAPTPSSTSPLLIVATLPPSPTPLPPLRIPRAASGDIFTPDNDATEASPNAIPGNTDKVAISAYGVLGVSLAGDDSYATIATPDGPHTVNMQSVINGHHIRSITVMGVTLDDGSIIPRGLSVDTPSERPATLVPPIASPTPATPQPTPQQQQQQQLVPVTQTLTTPAGTPAPVYTPNIINPLINPVATPTVINTVPQGTPHP